MLLSLLRGSAAQFPIRANEVPGTKAHAAVAVSECWDGEYSFAACCVDYAAGVARQCWRGKYTYKYCCLKSPLLSDVDARSFDAPLDCGCDERMGAQNFAWHNMTHLYDPWHDDFQNMTGEAGATSDDSEVDDDAAHTFWCTVRTAIRVRETFLFLGIARRRFQHLTARQMAVCPFGVLSILANEAHTILNRQVITDETPMHIPAFLWIREWFTKSGRSMLHVAQSGDWYIFSSLVLLKFRLSPLWDRHACAGVDAEPRSACQMVGDADHLRRKVREYVYGGDDLRYSFGYIDRAPAFDAATITLHCPFALAVQALLHVFAVRWKVWGSMLTMQAQGMETMALDVAELTLETSTKNDLMAVMCSQWPLLELVDGMRFYPHTEFQRDSEVALRWINDGVMPRIADNYSREHAITHQLFDAHKIARAVQYRDTTFTRHADHRLMHFIDKKWNAFDLLGPVFPLCPEADLQVYGADDEERRICDLAKLANGNPCIVVAIGSNGDWGFEEAVHHRTDCVIHVFDCYDNYSPPPRIRDRVFSYRWCLSGRRRVSRNQRFVRYHELLRQANVTTPVTFLKMDTEGAEWLSLPDILEVGREHKHMLPAQIAVELHRFAPVTSRMPLRIFAPSDIRVLGDILFAAGYVIIHRRDNVWGGAFSAEFLLAFVGSSEPVPRFAPSVPSSWFPDDAPPM